MITKVFITSLSQYSADEVSYGYEKIKDNFVGNGRISHRKESIVARLMLHKALSELETGEYSVIYSDDDKPVLKNKKGLFFNVSHSDDYVALALSGDEVGCDIQEIRPYNPKVAVRHYCENETALIENSADKDDAFIRLWALKESILKYSGKGLSGGLATYDFSPYAKNDTFTAFGCNFYVKKIDNAYFALCHKATEFKIEKTDL